MAVKNSKTYRELLDKTEKQQDNVNLFVHGDFLRAKESTEAQVKLAGLKDYYAMRRGWGTFLKWCLGIILAFNIFLVILVGINFLRYRDEWFLRIVLTTNLADIIGLVYLVVRFLFSNQIEGESQKPLKS